MEEETGSLAERGKVQEPVHVVTEHLFDASDGKDQASLDWLREHSGETRCAQLLQQIEAWAEGTYREHRALARAQGITVTNATRSTTAGCREAARRHFRSAIAQERGRLTCFAVAVCGALADGSASSANGEDTPLPEYWLPLPRV